MAKVLIRIKRSNAHEFFGGGGFNRHPDVVYTDKYEPEMDPTTKGEFFEVDERDVKTAVAEFAQKNPGKAVQVFTMTMEGVCPPSELVLKNVGKDGILPV